MPDAKPLGTKAKHILAGLAEVCEGVRGDIPDIAFHTRMEHAENARRAERHVEEVNFLTIKVLTLLLSNDLDGAELALNQFKTQRQKEK